MIKTPKQAYEGMVAWFSKPGAKLSRAKDSDLCYYQHPDNPNRRCAVGCLIPNKVLISLHESGQISSSLNGLYDTLVKDKVFGGSSNLREFLYDAQGCHDTAKSVKGFLSKLSKLYNNGYKVEP